MGKSSAKSQQDNDNFGNQEEILLGVLTAIDDDANTSQRTISRQLDVALGLANAYLKRCVRKGWIKIQQVPHRRYAYFLTPQGFAEKTRLTGQYLTASFNFFRQARNQISDLMGQCVEKGWTRIVFIGVSELAEVGTICAHDYPLKVLAVIDPVHAGGQFCGMPVHASVAECEQVDAAIITSYPKTDLALRLAARELDSQRVLVPKLLKLSQAKSAPAQEPTQAAAE